MSIGIQQATEIARMALQRRFIDQISVSFLEVAPAPVYMVESLDPQSWMFFAAHDPNVHRVGGSECLAVHVETAEVRFLGVIGE